MATELPASGLPKGLPEPNQETLFKLELLIPLSVGLFVVCFAGFIIFVMSMAPTTEQLKKQQKEYEKRRLMRNKRIAASSFPVQTVSL